jgi:hypothetical protein
MRKMWTARNQIFSASLACLSIAIEGRESTNCMQDIVPDPGALNPIPDTVVRRIPQLQGTSYIFGKTAIYFAAPPEYRVIAVVHRQ